MRSIFHSDIFEEPTDMADLADFVIRLVWIWLKVTIWKHFGFYRGDGQLALDKQNYIRDTTSLQNHILWFPPEEEEEGRNSLGAHGLSVSTTRSAASSSKGQRENFSKTCRFRMH